MSERLLFRVSEVADLIGVSTSKAYAMAASGELPAIRMGGQLRIPADALKELIDNRLRADVAVTAPERLGVR